MKKLCVLSLTMLTSVSFVYAGGEVLELGGLRSKTPADWKREKPSNNLRKHQFAVPKAEGDKEDADLAIFEFSGGSLAENIERWKKQFQAPEGKTIDESSKLEKYKVGSAADVAVFDISGTYLYKNPPFSPTAKVDPKKNFRRLNVLFDTDKGTYFFTLTGPAKTVEKNKAAFDGWVKAFK